MEIITRGVKPDDWWYEGQCIKCTTRVRFQAKEASGGKHCDDGHYVNCPICNHVITGKFVSHHKPANSSSYWDDRR